MIVPLAVIALATAIVLAWLPQIPDPSATHWSGGHPDDFGPPWVHPVLLAGAGGGIVALFATITLLAHRATRGRMPRVRSGRAPPACWARAPSASPRTCRSSRSRRWGSNGASTTPPTPRASHRGRWADSRCWSE
ncbi:DUF1648 domain-containing protein [Microbacterium sp. NIBRBAC000506063]|uniref:DUF1648 domain-containing protein n=1 Tax=Microbacterium sp. NIBRBAC000506063 TaxID=2734618 RepID=UPI001BB6755E|nr:DUF1648 domain-containing protein [Microbacterium sp. NIBRBAC000506063]QTV79897.1 DUF1648 domain-containing protein [Microbacterium sp. NIBRBAC000506063]